MSILKDYQDRKKRSFDLSRSHWDRAIDNYKHYFGRLDVGNTSEGDYPFQSQIVIPISYEIVETVMPRIIGRDPEFTTIAMESEDVDYEQVAKLAVESGYNNPKLELAGEPIYLKLQRGVKELLVTGNMVLRAYWRRETQKRMQYMANLDIAGFKNEADIKKVLESAKKLGKDGDVTFSKKMVDCPYLDDFDVKLVPFFFFLPDVEMVETGRMRYKIETDYMTLQELQDEAEIFGYDKAMMSDVQDQVKQKRSGFTPDITKDFMKSYNDIFATINPSALSTDDDKIPLLMVDKMWMGDKVAVFVNEKFNLTGDEGMDNPYDVKKDPFIFGHDVTIPHSYYSFGEIDAIKKMEDGNNDIVNMRYDNLLSSMLNYWLVNPNMVDPNDEFSPIPNSVTYVKDVDRSVRVINGNNVTATAYKESEELYTMIQRITGVNDYTKGNEGDTLAGRTYGGLRLVQEASNARFIVKSRLFEKLTLKSLGYFILEMSKQFINKDRIIRQFGEDGEAVTKGTISAGNLKSIKGFMDMKVVPNSAMVIDEQAEAMKMNNLADRFLTDKGPFANIPSSVYDKFMLKFLQLYGIHDAMYWVREIKKNRESVEKEAKKQAKVQSEAALPPMGPQLPPMGQPMANPGIDPLTGQPMIPQVPNPGLPPAMMPTMQSNGIGAQPNPLEMLMNAGG